MRKRTTRYRISNSNGQANIMSLIGAIIIAVVGFIMFQPFFWIVMIYGTNFHHITFLVFLMILGFIVGAPMFLFGLISILKGDHPVNPSSTAEMDLGRIRYTVETNKQEKK